MTPAQKHKELENRLSGFAQKYLIYRQMAQEEAATSVRARYINTMSKLRGQIQNVLFDMFIIDLEEKLNARKEEELCQEKESTQNSLPPVVSDGLTAQEA